MQSHRAWLGQGVCFGGGEVSSEPHALLATEGGLSLASPEGEWLRWGALRRGVETRGATVWPGWSGIDGGCSGQPCCHIRLLSCLGRASLEDHLKGKISTMSHLCWCPVKSKAKSRFAVTYLEGRLGGVQNPRPGNLVPALCAGREPLWKKSSCWRKVRGG